MPSEMGATFDVYLTGATDVSLSGHMRIAATIATRYRLPAPVVAEVLAEGGNCRIAEDLSAKDAEALVAALAALGATSRLSPAGGSPAAKNAGADLAVNMSATDGRPARPPPEPEPLLVDLPAGDTTRCPIHGLAYDRSRASGCVRCLAPVRSQVRTLVDASDDVDSGRPGQPAVRRAFMGLGLALLLGFLPAAYYARSSNRRDLESLRAQQAALSARAATPELLARFDELDAQVQAGHLRGAGRTLLIWIVVGGLVGAAWFKLSAPKET